MADATEVIEGEIIPRGTKRNGMACCPRCGTTFEPAKIYTQAEIAHNLGVAKGTVAGWMSKGMLPFRLWARHGRSISRVVLGADMMEFIDRRFPLPDPEGQLLPQRLWNWTQRNGAKGQRTMQANRRAKREAQRQQSKPDDVSTSPPDPTSKPNDP